MPFYKCPEHYKEKIMKFCGKEINGKTAEQLSKVLIELLENYSQVWDKLVQVTSHRSGTLKKINSLNIHTDHRECELVDMLPATVESGGQMYYFDNTMLSTIEINGEVVVIPALVFLKAVVGSFAEDGEKGSFELDG